MDNLRMSNWLLDDGIRKAKQRRETERSNMLYWL